MFRPRAARRASGRPPQLTGRHSVAPSAAVATTAAAAALVSAAALLEARRAVHRLVAAGLEGHLRFLPAARAGRGEHLACPPIAAGRIAAAVRGGSVAA